jgi:hypothetical protein
LFAQVQILVELTVLFAQLAVHANRVDVRIFVDVVQHVVRVAKNRVQVAQVAQLLEEREALLGVVMRRLLNEL